MDTLDIKLFDLPGDMYPLKNLFILFQVIKTVIFTHMRPKHPIQRIEKNIKWVSV